MISPIKAKSSRRLLLLLISFAMLSIIIACGGSLEDGTTSGGEGSVSVSASVESLAAGESSILTATVTDSTGTAVKGAAVAFSFISNKSGATIASLNGGITDSTGQAIATYTAGSSNSSQAVQDNIQVSVTGSTRALTLTRVSSSASATGFRLSLTAGSSSIIAGNSTIVTATITNASGSAVSGQAVTFTLLTNNSGATLTILSLGVTDNSGQAFAIYKAGANTPSTSVQDTLQASVTGATGVIMITRTSSAGSSNVVQVALSADSVSVAAGNSTLVRATVKTGDGAAVAGTAVTFSVATNNSGASLVPLNGGVTDASGVAVATYTAGSNNPTVAVQDIIQASITGGTAAIIITRSSSAGTSTGLKLTFESSLSSLEGGESAILKATVRDSSNNVVADEPVTFSFVDNLSGGHLSVTSTTTDAGGEATTVYTAGVVGGTTVQDILQASITGSSKALIITRTGTAASVTPAYLDITASLLELDTTSAAASTITVKALNQNYAEISDVVVTMAAETTAGAGAPGILSAPTVTSPGTVNFTVGSNKYNRTATITATAGNVSAQLPITISGSTVTVTSSATSLPIDGTTKINLTITATDKGGNAIPGTAVVMSQSSIGTGSVTFGSTSGTTDSNGLFTTTIMGVTDGPVIIKATAVGTYGTTNITVANTSDIFQITAPTGISPEMKLSDTMTVSVSAPSCSQVTFATTIGKFDDPDTGPVETSKTLTKTVTGDTASADLSSSVVGIANVEVYCSDAGSTDKDSTTVAISSDLTPAKIILQAASTSVPPSSSTLTYSTKLIATVYDANDNPLAGIPVAFSIVDGTGTYGGGESLSPVYNNTLTLPDYVNGLGVGQVKTTFTSGTMPSSGVGVKIRATVVGTSIHTGTSPSGNDIAIVIGGTAGSIAFGWDSNAIEDSTGGNYEYKMSVLVADANGNPVPNASVTLGVWPIAWAPGAGCDPDPTGAVDIYYLNEDDTRSDNYYNENMILDGTDTGSDDSGEDGARYVWDYTTHDITYIGHGTVDTRMTPTNSVGGTVPATVTTGTNGVAGFVLTYPKSSGVWIWDRIRATTLVQGTETRAETYLHLNILGGDESICNESPFQY